MSDVAVSQSERRRGTSAGRSAPRLDCADCYLACPLTVTIFTRGTGARRGVRRGDRVSVSPQKGKIMETLHIDGFRAAQVEAERSEESMQVP